MTKKAQKEKLQILKELVEVSEFNEEIKNTLRSMLSKIEITEKTAEEETLNSLIAYTCYPTRELKKQFPVKEMRTILSRIDYCYKYLDI